MPVYIYKCGNCFESIEQLKEIKDRNICPQCKMCGNQMIRQVEPTNIKFNGTGFYETDYKKRK